MQHTTHHTHRLKTAKPDFFFINTKFVASYVFLNGPWSCIDSEKFVVVVWCTWLLCGMVYGVCGVWGVWGVGCVCGRVWRCMWCVVGCGGGCGVWCVCGGVVRGGVVCVCHDGAKK